MKFENTAQVGDTIKAFNFRPMLDRPDSYIVGKVVRKGKIFHPTFNSYMYDGYEVEIQEGSTSGQLGETAYVPFEMSIMEFDDRVTRI